MTVAQLTLDGREVALDEMPDTTPLRYRRPPRLTLAQAAILQHIGEHGQIRTVEAGVIMHRHKGRCGSGARRLKTDRAEGCCYYAPADGLEALKRLQERGLVRRVPGVSGRWRQP